VVPINHMVVVTESLARSRPDVVVEISTACSRKPRKPSGCRRPAASIFLPFGFEACRPGLSTIVNYALQQNLIPRKIDVTVLFDDTTRALRP